MTSTHTIEHMEHPKLMFDKHVMARAPQVITFLPGQLVQVHCSDVWYTMASIHKLIPMWSFPWHVVSQDRNLNILETAGGCTINGTFSSRRLHRFWPRTGIQLAEDQARPGGDAMALQATDEHKGDPVESGAETAGTRAQRMPRRMGLMTKTLDWTYQTT